MTILIALSYITMFDASTTHRFSSLWLIYPLFGAASVHLFLLFPKEWEFIRRNHWLCYVPYLPAAVLIVLRSSSEYNPQLSIVFSKLSLLFMATVFVIDFALLFAAYKKATESVIKQRAKIVAYGLVLAALIPVAWSTVYAFWRPVIGVEYAIGLAVFFPILIGYAATKSRFFDIDLVIKKSISYALISSLLVLLYLLVVAIVSLLTQTLLALDSSPLEQIISTLAVVVAFDPLRRGVQHLIDRAFYRDRYLVQKGLLELSHRLSTEVFDVEAVASLVIRRLKEVAMYSASYMFLDDGNGRLILEYSDPSPSEPLALKAPPIKSGILSSGEIAFFDDLRANRDLDGQDLDRLSRLGVQCLVPMVTKSGLVGLVALAGPLSSLQFSSDERKLIESIAHQAAMSIENKRLYEQKSRDERLATLGKVSSMIIHEIKNPLGIIRVSSGTLKKRFEKENEREGLELASFIEEEVMRMDSTVRKFLAYVKPQEPENEVVNVNELVRKAISSLRCELEPFSVELRLDDSLEGITGDADHLYQLIVNLVFNAKDAMQPGGRLTVGTKDTGEAVYLTVADTGKGIEKEVQESIFKPFYSGRRGGIGLGLTIAQQIVENHGGVIRLKSRVGAGTVFRVMLPRRRKEARANWKN
jgi:signal transduction histidine kinase